MEKHHVLFTRYSWTASDELKKLRATRELIVPMLIIEHKLLHREIEQIPPPDHYMIKRINSEFYPARNDPIQTIKNLEESVMCALDNEYSSLYAHRLGHLIIDSLHAQIPYIERSL